MKQFNIAKQQQIVFNNVIPTNAIYGKFAATYNRRTIDDYKVVIDKNGNTVINKNGTPKVRVIYKETTVTTSAVYVIKKTALYKGRYIMCDLLYSDAKNWQKDIVLGDSIYTKKLQAFILRKLAENKIDLATHKIEVARVKSQNDYKPVRREVKVDYMYRGRPGYATNPHIINEDVRFDSHVHVSKRENYIDRPVAVTYRRPDKVFMVYPIGFTTENRNLALSVADELRTKGEKGVYIGYMPTKDANKLAEKLAELRK